MSRSGLPIALVASLLSSAAAPPLPYIGASTASANTGNGQPLPSCVRESEADRFFAQRDKNALDQYNRERTLPRSVKRECRNDRGVVGVQELSYSIQNGELRRNVRFIEMRQTTPSAPQSLPQAQPPVAQAPITIPNVQVPERAPEKEESGMSTVAIVGLVVVGVVGGVVVYRMVARSGSREAGQAASRAGSRTVSETVVQGPKTIRGRDLGLSGRRSRQNYTVAGNIPESYVPASARRYRGASGETYVYVNNPQTGLLELLLINELLSRPVYYNPTHYAPINITTVIDDSSRSIRSLDDVTPSQINSRPYDAPVARSAGSVLGDFAPVVTRESETVIGRIDSASGRVEEVAERVTRTRTIDDGFQAEQVNVARRTDDSWSAPRAEEPAPTSSWSSGRLGDSDSSFSSSIGKVDDTPSSSSWDTPSDTGSTSTSTSNDGFNSIGLLLGGGTLAGGLMGGARQSQAETR
jgi:hypothetical protein